MCIRDSATLAPLPSVLRVPERESDRAKEPVDGRGRSPSEERVAAESARVRPWDARRRDLLPAVEVARAAARVVAEPDGVRRAADLDVVPPPRDALEAAVVEADVDVRREAVGDLDPVRVRAVHADAAALLDVAWVALVPV